jgi:hypothetical protein
MQQKSTVDESELQTAMMDLVGPLGNLSKGEAVAIIELHESYLAGRERVSLPKLLQDVEWLGDFLEQNGTFTEGIFRLSAPLSQLDALCILLMLRPEIVTNEVLLRASAVTVACVFKRLVSLSATPILSMSADDPMEGVTDPMARKILHRVVRLSKTCKKGVVFQFLQKR